MSTGKYKLDIHGFVHHNTFRIKVTNKMQLCKAIHYSNVPRLICMFRAIFIAHHQEHLNCNYSFWFYSRVFRCRLLTAADNDTRE